MLGYTLIMPLTTDSSLHSNLYRYWDTKRGTRLMPTRPEIDPIEIPLLLPYITLIDRGPANLFRYRLMGTAVSRQLGRDLTGQPIGAYSRHPHYAEEILAVYEALFAGGPPMLITSEFRTDFGTIQASCRLMVPLGSDGNVTVAMSVWTARSATGLTASADWGPDITARMRSAVPANGIEDVEELSHAWERDYPSTQP